jgi:hypothetical protein
MVVGPATLATADAAVARSEVPWAAALNVTAPGTVVSVTLLALDVVGDHLHINGVLRIGTRRDVRVLVIPSLVVAPPGEAPWPMLDARAVPRGPFAWVSWTYLRPGLLPGRLVARIENIVLEYRTGGTERVDVPGPWEFSLLVQEPAHLQVRACTDDVTRRA